MSFNLNSLTLARRLSLGFVLVLGLVMLIAGLSLVSLQRARAASERIAAAKALAADADRWRAMTVLNVERTLALAQGNGAESLKTFLAPRLKQTSSEISTLQKHLEEGADPAGKALFADIAVKRSRYLATRDDLFKRMDSSDPAAADMLRTQLLPQANEYAQAVTAFGEGQRQAADAVVATCTADVDRARVATCLLAAVCVVAGALCAWRITRSVTRPLTQAVDAVKAIASGDLNTRIDVRGHDEVTFLLAGLDEMQGALRSLVGKVRGTTDSIQVASREVAQGSLDLSQRTERAAASLQETASSVEQISGTVRQTAEAARTADDLVARAAQAARAGGEVASHMSSTMERITGHSGRIGDIVGVINGIAFQTNILALNAAVESARAGEQGRGFAVVANEVRALAQRSASAANEIGALIRESAQAVGEGARLARDAQTSMEEIDGAVQRVISVIGEISHAATEQADGVGLINTTVAQLDQSTQQNAALVEETAAAADSLRDQASQLVEAVSVFRLDAQAA